MGGRRHAVRFSHRKTRYDAVLRPLYLRSLLPLATLSTLILVVPLLTVLRSHPEFFLAHKLGVTEVILFVFLLIAGCLLMGAAGAWNRYLTFVFVFVLGSLEGAALLKRFDLVSPHVSLVWSFAFGVCFSACYHRYSIVRKILTTASPSMAIVPILFFCQPAIWDFITSPRAPIQKVPLQRTPPIVMVIFDELPLISLLNEKTEIDAVRYPNFAAFANRSTWYKRAFSVSNMTHHAVPAILTGKTRSTLSTPNLYSLLAGTYGARMWEEITHFTDSEPSLMNIGRAIESASASYLHIVRPVSWESHLPNPSEGWKLALRPRQADKSFKDFLASIEASSKPVLYFNHVLLPHVPYRFLPTGEWYDGPIDPGEKHIWAKDPWVVRESQRRSLLQLGYVDRLVDQLTERLKRVGIFDDALIIITSDHGKIFVPGRPGRGETIEELKNVALVPLFIKAPGQTHGAIADINARTIDILPTIMAQLGVTNLAFDGTDLANPNRKIPAEGPIIDFGEQIPYDFSIASLPDFKNLMSNFGSGQTRPNGLWQYGEYRELIGKEVASFLSSALPAHELIWQMDQRFVSGKLTSGPDMKNSFIALSVNGKIRAITRFRVDRNNSQIFYTLLPEPALRSATEIFSIEAKNGAIMLSPFETLPIL